MKSSKKRPAPARWPKGSPNAGKFGNPNLIREYQAELAAREKAAKKAQQRERKNARDRARRQQQRDTRKQFTLTKAREEYQGWGTASTSRLREGNTYKFHGAYRITAGGSELTKILNAVGSSNVRPTALGDGNYEVIVTPGLGNFTPEEFYSGAVQSYDTDWFQSQFGAAENVEFLGAFWRPDQE